MALRDQASASTCCLTRSCSLSAFTGRCNVSRSPVIRSDAILRGLRSITTLGIPHTPGATKMSHRLVRSTDRIVAGVCAGIAEFVGWQPVSIRTLFALLAFVTAGGFGVIYVILWWMMPADDGSTRPFRLDDFRA
jgi:phage shock protein C